MSDQQKSDSIEGILSEVDDILAQLSALLPPQKPDQSEETVELAPQAVPQPTAQVPEIPEGASKGHIRRVAVLYSSQQASRKDALIKFISETARTIAQQPLYLRVVLCEEVGPELELEAILARVKEVKAVAILGLLDKFSPAKVWKIGQFFDGARLCFRVVEPGEIENRSAVIDILIELTLLSPED